MASTKAMFCIRAPSDPFQAVGGCQIEGRFAVVGLGEGEAFAERIRLMLGERWQLDDILISGDGPVFVKTVVEHIEESYCQLSWFNLQKVINRAIDKYRGGFWLSKEEARSYSGIWCDCLKVGKKRKRLDALMARLRTN